MRAVRPHRQVCGMIDDEIEPNDKARELATRRYYQGLAVSDDPEERATGRLMLRTRWNWVAWWIREHGHVMGHCDDPRIGGDSARRQYADPRREGCRKNRNVV